MNLYLSVLKKYSDFEGRACRTEYWTFTLINIIISIILTIIMGILQIPGIQLILSLITILFSLIIIIPGIAVTIRRLHDSDKSGWFLLLAIIPVINFIGSFIILYFLFKKGTDAENRFGSSI